MTGLTPEREAALERALDDLRNKWRVSEESGSPVPDADKVWHRVFIELLCVTSDYLGIMAIAEKAQRWMETRNPFYVDTAIYLCSLANIEPTTTLNALAADVANLRLKGRIRGGTPKQVEREQAKTYALDMMSCLCAAGETQEIAASKAAKRLMDLGSYQDSLIRTGVPIDASPRS